MAGLKRALSFGKRAKAYETARPGYPAGTVEWLLSDAVDVVDVGAGTGKLARVLLGPGRRVRAVEPDPAMRATLARALPEMECLAGAAEALPLPDASVDLLTFGQAWHWVDPEAACAEAARVLRPGGALGPVWNVLDPDIPWVGRLLEIIQPSPGERMALAGRPPFTAPFTDAEGHTERWSRTVDRGTVLDLVRSRSHVITAAPDEQRRIIGRVIDLLDGHPGLAGKADVVLPYRTHCWRITR